MSYSTKKYKDKMKAQAKSNPGRANREARKANRGETFVGCRATRFDSGKTKARSRAAIKKETANAIRNGSF